jgi:hypothetical protein
MAGNVLQSSMTAFQHTPPYGGAFARRFTRYTGLFFDEFAVDSAWIRETGVIRLPPMADEGAIVLKGEFLPHPEASGPEAGFPSLEVFLDGKPRREGLRKRARPLGGEDHAGQGLGPEGLRPHLTLQGCGFTNALAWLGRVTRLGPLQRYRPEPEPAAEAVRHRVGHRRAHLRLLQEGEPLLDRVRPLALAHGNEHRRLPHGGPRHRRVRPLHGPGGGRGVDTRRRSSP